MKRLIIIGMTVLLLSGCATAKVMDKTIKSEPVKTEDKENMILEWLDWLQTWISNPWK